MTPKTLSLIALAGLAAASLSTAALAERGPGPDGAFPMQMFDTIDADKDGRITQAEIDAHRKAEVAAADADKDGFMTADELSAMHLKALTARADAMAARMVDRLDSDGDGRLSAAEMAARPMGERLFDRADADADGAITRAEAEAALREMADGPRHGKRKHPHGTN